MIINIISIILNIVFFVIINQNLFTDHSVMIDGTQREWQRSPLDRLYAADKAWLFYLQIIVSAISIITNILVIVGVKNSVVKTIQAITTAASVIVFIVIMAVALTTHPKY